MSRNQENKNSISGEFIDAGQAAELLGRATETRRLTQGSLSLHWLEDDNEHMVLAQGANGEFAVLR